MKGRGTFSLLTIVLVAFGLGYICLYGIGSTKLLSVNHIKQGLDLSGGAYIVYEADKPDVTEDEMKTALSLIQDRLDRKGYAEAEAARQGSNRIRVDIPGVENAESAISEIGQTAQLMFVDSEGKILLTGDMVEDARKAVGPTQKGGMSQPYVTLTFTPGGSVLFAQATQDNIGQPIALVLADTGVSSPVVSSVITNGEGIITGSFTPEGAEELAALIKAGSLPFNLNVIQMQNIGARLGANAMQTSIFAAYVGISLVFLFMLIMYRASGLAADLALVVYVSLEMIVLSALGVTLTLPGIAGIVLSIGMAVDANVIIFERIKEELTNGKTLRTAVDMGFKRAFPAIFDGNITTLLAAAILFWMGTGTIKGFAQTLSIGIVISMFTALVITRFIVKAMIQVGINNPKLYGFKSKIKGGCLS